MNKPKDEPGLQTILSHCGRNLEASGGYVNVPPYEGSTILHPFSTPEQQDGGIEPPPVLASRFFRFLNLP